MRLRIRPRRTVAALAVGTIAAGLLHSVAPAPTARADDSPPPDRYYFMPGQSQSWTTAGLHEWTVPTGVTRVRMRGVGGRGGGPLDVRSPEYYGIFNVVPGEKLNLWVGGSGSQPTGGWNGGGDGGAGYNGGAAGYGGGGASEVRLAGNAADDVVMVVPGAGGQSGNWAGDVAIFSVIAACGEYWGSMQGSSLRPGNGGTGCTTPGSPGVGTQGGDGGSGSASYSPGGGGGGGLFAAGGGGDGSPGAHGGVVINGPAGRYATTEDLAGGPNSGGYGAHADSPRIEIGWDLPIDSLRVINGPHSVSASGASKAIDFTTVGADGVGFHGMMVPSVSVSAGAVSAPTRISSSYWRVYVSGVGSAAAPVTMTVRDTLGGSASLEIPVTKVAQTVRFTGSAPADATNGQSSAVAATATSGLPVTFSASGACSMVDGKVKGTGVGTCTVTASQAGDDKYEAASPATRTFEVAKADQVPTLSVPATIPFDQSASVQVTEGGASTAPVLSIGANLSGCQITGMTVTFARVGACELILNQAGDGNYNNAEEKRATITAVKAAQAITLVTPSRATVEGTVELAATGGASGSPIAYDLAADSVGCTLTGSRLTFTESGTCKVRATQAGSDNYEAAPAQERSIEVDPIVSGIAISLDETSTAYSQNNTVSAAVTGGAAGTVQYLVDGQPFGAPVTIADGEAAAVDLSALEPGVYAVGARFDAANDRTHSDATAPAQQLMVATAATTTSLSTSRVGIDLQVDADAPATAVVNGTAEVTVNGELPIAVQIVEGVGHLPYRQARATDVISVVFTGTSRFLTSVATTSRTAPSITARVVSSGSKNRAGWYRTPVRVEFTCVQNGAALSAACPAALTVPQGRAQRVERTIESVDGGVASVAIANLNVDLGGPKVRFKGGTGVGAKPTCVASDAVSGILHCRVKRTVQGTTAHYVATATDRAGHVSVARTKVALVSARFAGAPRIGRTYVVRAGARHQLMVKSTKRPRYVVATPAPGKPTRVGNALRKVGKDTWAISVRFEQHMGKVARWNIGVKIGGRVVVLPLTVVR